MAAAQPSRSLRLYLEPLDVDQIPTLWPQKTMAVPDSVKLPFNPKSAWLRRDDVYDDLYIQRRNELGMFLDMEIAQLGHAHVTRASEGAQYKERDEKTITHFTQLPPNLDRLAALAERVAGESPSPAQKAIALRDHLQSSYGYTTDLPPVDRDNPVEDFLFVTQRGHCEFFATSMVLMLRSQGVPARLVNGFLGGTWNEAGDYMAVRQGDAHAWVEVYLPSVGWVPFDPTPSQGTVPTRPDPIVAWIQNSYDAARMAWLNWIIEYDLDTQIDAIKRLGNLFSPSGGSFGGGSKDTSEDDSGSAPLPIRPVVLWTGFLFILWMNARMGRRARAKRSPRALLKIALIITGWATAGALWQGWFHDWRTAWIIAGALAALAAAAAGFATWRYTKDRSERAVAQAGRWFIDVERAASRAGMIRDPSQGPGAFLDEIAARYPDARSEILHARALYLAARFGARTLEDRDTRALKGATQEGAIASLRRAARQKR